MVTGSIQRAFVRVKNDIEELRNLQNSAIEAMRVKLGFATKSLQEQQNTFINKQKQIEVVYKDKLDVLKNLVNKISKTNKSAIEHEFVKVDKRVSAIEQRNKELLSGFNDQIATVEKSVRKLSRDIDLISSKLQEFENISVDIEEIDKSYVTTDSLIRQLGNPKHVKKTIKRLANDVDSIKNKVRNYEESIGEYALAKNHRKTEEDVIALKSNLVFRNHFEDMNSRIDMLENKTVLSTEALKKNHKKIEDNIGDVIALKKSFVTKEQYKMLRKEIKLLVQGLKDIQKIKTKLNTKNKGISNFFIEDE